MSNVQRPPFSVSKVPRKEEEGRRKDWKGQLGSLERSLMWVNQQACSLPSHLPPTTAKGVHYHEGESKKKCLHTMGSTCQGKRGWVSGIFGKINQISLQVIVFPVPCFNTSETILPFEQLTDWNTERSSQHSKVGIPLLQWELVSPGYGRHLHRKARGGRKGKESW